MIPIATYINDLITFSNNLESHRRRAALRAAETGKALNRRRVQSQRLTIDGGIFGTYNPEYFKRKKKKLSSDNRINFTDTGRMMSDLTAEITKETPSVIEITVRPKTAHLKERLGYMEELQERKNRDPDIIAWSDEEEAMLLEDYLDEWDKILEESGL